MKRWLKLLNAASSASEPQSFDYTVKRQRRKTIALHILSDGSVEVRAPKWVPARELASFVEQRADWVLRQRQRTLQKIALRPGFGHGERHYFLGQQYPLQISLGGRNRVSFCGEALHLQLISDAPDVIEKQLNGWYRRRSLELFEQRLDLCMALFSEPFRHRYPRPTLKVRKMRRRWGSCSSRGVVTLNPALVKMPIECIDYVLCHELCHLAVFNHGREFYQLLASVLPDWQQREKLLEQCADY